MKYSAALSLAVAPMALAKAIHNVYPPAKRNGHMKEESGGDVLEKISGDQSAFLHGGVSVEGATQVIVIWANPGASAETTTVNEQVTVTQTVTEAGATATEAAAATHTVTVGGDAGLVFTPTELTANPGDMVIFSFEKQMHTATQSSFDTPCDPLEGGMDTDTQPNPNNTISPPPQVAMQVMTSEPLWFYCKTGNHCGQGMTFAINPTAEKTFAQFQAKAIEQKGSGTPSAIVGGNSSAPPAAESSAAAAPPAESASATASAGGAEATAGLEMGQGTVNPDGSCNCAVTCSMGNFPAMEAQGMGAFGGYAGKSDHLPGL
ncbi:hypothetical protein SLS62_002194 [Diatrype stigma]|uniref:Serine-threonine rich protein n=1 Tax=Diatrype stigma TaxID=117547 RepID=A0AAN9UYY3_9PEZI